MPHHPHAAPAWASRSVAVYSDADARALHVRAADEAVRLGPAPAAESYLDVDAILEAARATRAPRRSTPATASSARTPSSPSACEARGHRVHRPDARADARLRPEAHGARAGAREHGVPLLPGTGLLADRRRGASRAAERIGYPVMLKSTAGGGGIGMRVLRRRRRAGARPSTRSQRLARANFERRRRVPGEVASTRARHVEVQIFGDGAGSVLALGERDCSLQRRNQKVIEETPAPGLPPTTRARAARRRACGWAQRCSYRSAGTVEFVYDADARRVLLPRGQHAAPGRARRHRGGHRRRPRRVDGAPGRGRAAAARRAARRAARARDPGARLRRGSRRRTSSPSAGLLTEVALPDGRARRHLGRARHRGHAVLRPAARQDHRARRRPRRGAARGCARRSARRRVDGIETNLDYLRAGRCATPAFVAGGVTTRLLDELRVPRRARSRCSTAGTQTTVQDYPGRARLLGRRRAAVGPDGRPVVPARQPRCVGNAEGAAGLEMHR